MARSSKGQSRRSAPTSYDEGRTLRSTLVEVALSELERVDHPSTVTIAAIVKGAGCTPPSLYHYWPTRENLLSEAAALGWSRFEASQSAAAVDPRPRERIRARGRAYLRFAQERPALFRVLFLGAPIPTQPESNEAADRGPAFWALRDDVGAALADRAAEPGRLDATELAMTLWCAIHGLAVLSLGDPTGQATHSGMVATIDEVVLGLDAGTSQKAGHSRPHGRT